MQNIYLFLIQRQKVKGLNQFIKSPNTKPAMITEPMQAPTLHSIFTLPGQTGYQLFTFTDAEHGRPTGRANTFAGWFTIFHGNCFGTFHFFLDAAFYTIRFHLLSSHYSLVISYLKHGDILTITGGIMKNHLIKNQQEPNPAIFILL